MTPADSLFAAGQFHLAAGCPAQAVAAFAKLAALLPDSPAAQINLAIAHLAANQPTQAIPTARTAISLDPTNPKPWLTLGSALKQSGDPAAASDAYRRAITLSPTDPEPHNNLAAALMDTGDVHAALAEYRRALALAPDNPRIHSNLLYALHFSRESTPESLLAAHKEWSARHEQPLLPTHRPHHNDPDPDRPVRVAYVSPNFYDHPVGRFITPLITHHDRAHVHITCYADLHSPPDYTTATLREAADTWRDTTQFTAPQLAAQVRADRIDLLVDLTAHMAGHRLLAFAHKPAPVQLTYLAYPGTTGLRSINHRLTDPQIDPPGTDPYSTEHSLRLPTYWCYPPPPEAPDVTPLPAATNGHITFAALNNPAKNSRAALETWAAILRSVPNSRLLLHARQGHHRPRLLETFRAQGADLARIELIPFLSRQAYYQAYTRTDIALDPFPYAGGTTTCDALWNGNPVVTLKGETAVSRGGASLLSTLHLPDLITDTPAAYTAAAIALATDRERLTTLRATLRDRMRASPLMNPTAFARAVESAYRTAWRTWCASRAARPLR